MLATLLVITALVMIATPAHAYVDPGTGSLIIQAAVAMLLGGGLAFRRQLRRLRDRLRGKSSDPVPSPERDDAP